MEKKFITPVSMVYNNTEQLKYLVKGLEKLGYTKDHIEKIEKGLIATNLANIANKFSNFEIIGDADTRFDRYFIEEYNPDLFLALAAMNNQKMPIKGEYIVGVKTFQFERGIPFKVTSINDHTFSVDGREDKDTQQTSMLSCRKATKEEIINHFTKNKNIMTKKIFPLKLRPADAQRIIGVACSIWKTKLANQWGKYMVLDEVIDIHEDDYKEMRKACTESQNKLFDEIFGADVVDNNAFVKEFECGTLKDTSKKLFGDGNALQIATGVTKSKNLEHLHGRALYIHSKYNVEIHKLESGSTIIEITKK